MKILFDGTELSYFNENSGHKAGVFYVSKNLLDEFINKGLNITLTCDFKRYYFLKEVLENNYTNIPLLEEHSVINKLIAKILYITRDFPLKFKYVLLILARYYDAYLYKRNDKNLKQLENFDVYFSPYTPPSNEITNSSLKRFRIIHDVIPIIEHGSPKSPKDWYYKIYNSINNKDCYLTNSEYTRQDVLKYFPFIKESNIKTTLLGANNKFTFDNSSKSPIADEYIFSLCTLGKRKNLEAVIKNFFNFIDKNKIQNLKLVLGGSIWEKYRGDLDLILKSYDSSKIILTGYIEEDDLAKYYSNALCFIYPSLYEGFGLPVLEAMQCGCPVICSNTTSLPEVIGDAGIQINPENDEEMIQAYEKMYFNSDFRNKCRQLGLDRAQSFSWGKCADEILDFIKEN